MEPQVNIQTSTPPSTGGTPAQTKGLSPWAIARKKFLRNKLAMGSLVVLLLIAGLSIFAEPLTMPMEETAKQNIMALSKQPGDEYILGTDKQGRDVFARLLHGGKISLTLAFSITSIILIIGSLVGSMAGYFGGKVDAVLMRFVDFVMTFPFLLFVIVVQATFGGGGIISLILVISLLSWGGVARMVRGKIMAEKENEYILAAVSIGCKTHQVILKHLIPNVLSTIIVNGTLILASMIVAETALSFLGFGVPLTTPTWGNMLQEARSPDVLAQKIWIWIPPAAVLTTTILCINFIGEGLKDALNPKSFR
ncbi:oligopeptide ABC transporter permease [Mangrovibacillus cuniculi]|uniref:ABC transporter permease n=1 Tax=Mangrovibacillus cuniculi TaxID=2593652 RepID=A0A7S8HEP2_9BACI|nr:oligopeptide ABC transporter permease [Mangrovibacillus cuniculi]QPC46069.1 ABC transporter permease [Mangrovibacillus cuniculi]